MPALFVVSGILFHPRFWKKTILALGIPVMFYSILNLLFYLAIGDITIWYVFTKESLFRFIHYRYGLGAGLFMGDWFLWALLALRFLFGDIHFMNVFRKYYIYIALFAVIYMTFESYLITVDELCHGWYIGRALPSLPFFCMGFFLKDKGWNPKKMSKNVVLLLLPFFVVLPMINGYCSINENEYGISYVLFFLNAAVSTLLLFFISSLIKQSKVITFFSKGTLLILGLHMPIMRLLEMILPSFMNDFLPLFVLPICYFPIMWLVRWCPELLGKLR